MIEAPTHPTLAGRVAAPFPVSVRLAQRLGYRPAGTCEVLWVS